MKDVHGWRNSRAVQSLQGCRIPRVLRVFLLLVALLVACFPPSLPRVIKIGLVAPFEGRYRYIGYDAIYAARLAVREINAAGGVGGWLLELVAYDDRAEPELARATARSLVADSDVIAVIGHYRQASTVAASAIYAEAEIPLLLVGTWLTPTMPESSPVRVWHMQPPPEQVATAMVDAANACSPLSALLEETESWAIWGDDPLAVALDDVLSVRSHHPGGVLSVRESARVAFSTMPPIQSATRLVEARASGWDGTLIGGLDIASPDFLAVAGVFGEAVLFVTPYPLPYSLPGLEAWDADYRAVGPHVPDPGIYALPTYEAVYTFAIAITAVAEAGGLLSREHVAAALPGVRRVGALGTVTWDAAGYWRDMPLYVYVWEQTGARLVDRRR